MGRREVRQRVHADMPGKEQTPSLPDSSPPASLLHVGHPCYSLSLQVEAMS